MHICASNPHDRTRITSTLLSRRRNQAKGLRLDAMSAQGSPVPPVLAEELTVRNRLSEQDERQSMASSRSTLKHIGFRAGVGLEHVARRTIGIFLLLVTVFLWTASNFLASVSLVHHSKIIELTGVVHICGQHFLKAILCHIHQHFLLCNITHPNLATAIASRRVFKPARLGDCILERSTRVQDEGMCSNSGFIG